MPYKGAMMSVSEMVDELVQNGRDNRSAAIELSRALEDGAIILIFNDAPLRPSHVAGVTEYVQLTAAKNEREIRLRLGWVADIILFSRALRAQFEAACGLAEREAAAPISIRRRFASDETLVKEALDGIRNGKWPNALQAAKALANQADGASPEAIVDRLRKKITAASN